MQINKGIKLRLTIHNILFEIHHLNKNFDNLSLKKKIKFYNQKDTAFINNVCLSSMRYYYHTQNIINLYLRKKSKRHEKILLISAITQIVFLDFSDYAVVNSSVEIAKKLKIYPGLINSVLKKIVREKKDLIKIKVEFDQLPEWFQKKTVFFSKKDKEKFIKNYYKKPNVHLVFKNNDFLKKFESKIENTSNISGFLNEDIKINKVESYESGAWWVQDFSSFLPLSKLVKDKFQDSIDLCSAPGGKAFQALINGLNITLNDISSSRLIILKKNLARLKLSAKITNYNALLINETKKYDFIILDAPCSSIGTIRKNPEILFKINSPNFKSLLKLQQNLLEKANLLLNNNGVILYMVCSFFYEETFKQIDTFLKKNKDFFVNSSYFNKDIKDYKYFYKKNCMFTIPSEINGFGIDGYFAVYLEKK